MWVLGWVVGFCFGFGLFHFLLWRRLGRWKESCGWEGGRLSVGAGVDIDGGIGVWWFSGNL